MALSRLERSRSTSTRRTRRRFGRSRCHLRRAPDPHEEEPAARGFAFSSREIVSDVCRWLGISPGKKDSVVSFPELANEDLKWAFLRGYFDGDGSVSSLKAARALSPYPRCSIASTSESMLHAIQSFCGIPCHRGKGHLEWSGNNALDLMARLYDGAPIFLRRKRDLYLDWSTWVPGLGGGGNHGRELQFRWVKCLAEARRPTKAHASDSGYDLTLVQTAHRTGRVQFFRTGVKVQPSYGWYFDLVPRSSISKTGYMLANSIGIIDRTYVGEILVPLIKIDDGAPDLQLPARVVQLIPRPIIHAEFVEVSRLDETERGDGGYGSTGRRLSSTRRAERPSPPTRRSSRPRPRPRRDRGRRRRGDRSARRCACARRCVPSASRASATFDEGHTRSLRAVEDERRALDAAEARAHLDARAIHLERRAQRIAVVGNEMRFACSGSRTSDGPELEEVPVGQLPAAAIDQGRAPRSPARTSVRALPSSTRPRSPRGGAPRAPSPRGCRARSRR